MKNKEESSTDSLRGNASSPADEIRQQLLDGTYRPSPVRRKTIDKPDGGQRLLGIPNVIERLIQQAIVQVLTPIFDPHFSESNFGVRPKRSAHGAAKQVQRTMRRGFRHVADIDLSKFFDRVNHDILMSRVARKVGDKVLLRLIGRYLRAGVMVEGVLQPTEVGAPQGGPLSPILSNILLDDLDKELERRGLSFVRYADDFAIFAKSKRSAERIMTSVSRFVTDKLRLASQLKLFDRLDQWIRRRIRMCDWKQWKRPRKRRRELIRRGVPRRQAIRHARSRKAYWHMSKTIASGVGLTNAWLAE